MVKKNDDFSQADLAQMLRRPEAQALLARLRELDQNALQQAAQMAFSGNTEGAKELLTPLLNDEQVQKTAEKLRNADGGI